MKSLYLYFLVIVILCGCTDDTSLHQQLLQAESMIDEHPDSAYHIPDGMMYDAISNDEDRALYGLLLNEAEYKLYKPIDQDSLLWHSITYYNKVHDKERFAVACYYQGVICYDKDRKEDATKALKQAELLAEEMNDLLLRNKVYESLHMVNNYSRNYSVSLEYARKFLHTSRMLQDSVLISRAYEHISSSYLRLGLYDSSRIYQEKCLPLLKYLSVNDRAIVCANYASDLIGISKYDDAFIWLKRAMAYKPAANQYVMMGKVYLHLRDTATAEKYFLKVPPFKDIRFTIKADRLLSEIYRQRHDYIKAHRMLYLADSLENKQDPQVMTAELAKVQTDYDKQTFIDMLHTKMVYLLLLGIALCLVSVVVFLMFWRQRRYKNVIKKFLRQVEQKKDRITQLEKDRSDSFKEKEYEIALLNRQIIRMQQETSERMARGKSVYEHVLNKERLIDFSKQAEQDFIDYYAITCHDRFLNTTKGYHYLRMRHVTYLILLDMGLTDKEITHVLSIADGTIRTYRHRINKSQKI